MANLCRDISAALEPFFVVCVPETPLLLCTSIFLIRQQTTPSFAFTACDLAWRCRPPTCARLFGFVSYRHTPLLSSAHLTMRRKYVFVGQVLLLLLITASLYVGSHHITRLPAPIRLPSSGSKEGHDSSKEGSSASYAYSGELIIL
jgi:hypothetical protein